MPLYDLRNNLGVAQTLAPAVRTASATGAAVAIGEFSSVMVVFEAGAITAGTHTPSVSISTDGGTTWTAVANADLQGDLSALAANSVQRVGFVGYATHIRGDVAVSGATPSGASAATVILGHPSAAPVA